ncbi:MAG TPA: tetratricopeptide repeat protein [Terriglobales bacterium]|nr:tetratricopeptide repeat protein [Terriglobales bacterium]
MALAVLILLSSAMLSQAQINTAPDQQTATARAGGSQTCASCHTDIYRSYSTTAMARASGPAADGLIAGDFKHARTGIQYRVYSHDGRVWLSFDRDHPPLHGKRELLYYIGSGTRGRTYLFSEDGFLFESPVNWYAQKRLWDMTPAYQSTTQMPMLPALPSCLNCHTSGMRAPLPGTENRYTMPPFAHGGISCQRCHGPGEEHVRGQGKAAMINPAKLAPERRDEICMECHLEGSVAVERAGKHTYDFRPGDRLSDYIRYFDVVNLPGLGALSQVEALAQSVCKQKSGDSMSCMSCHDPHSWPAPEEKVSYYRSKCLACHGAAFGRKHQHGNPDCIGCHMPAVASRDVAHTQATDHRILRRPGPQLALTNLDSSTRAAAPQLVPFPASAGPPDIRDLALAWDALVRRGNEQFAPKARELLTEALRENPGDAAVATALAYMEQRDGNAAQAKRHYEEALRADPTQLDATVNLGVIEAQSGDPKAALKLWQDAFQRAPAHSAIGIDLALVSCDLGQVVAARDYLSRVLQFNPDLEKARRFLEHLNAQPPRCEP